MAGKGKHKVEFVRKRLRRFILEGYFPPDQPLPPILKLAEIFRVSLVTAQSAIHLLRHDGLVETKRGHGVYVKYPLTWNSQGRSIGLLHPFEKEFLKNTPYPGKALRVLKDSLKQGGYELIPISLREIGLADFSTFMQEQELAGVILLEVESGRVIEELGDLGLPVVSMDYDAYRQAVPSVSFDNLNGGFLATKHLIEHGHRRIAFARRIGKRLKLRSIMGHNAILDSVDDDRIRGYRLAMEEATLEPIFYENRTPLDPETLDAFFVHRTAPTALVCMGDLLAAQLAQRMEARGYRIPEDISLIGFGATNASFGQGRKITSVWIDLPGLGKHAAELFLETVKGAPLRRVVLPVRLETNDSVAEPCPVAPAALTETRP